jgi:MraZ protein
LKLDAKNRLFIPADVRRLIDPEVHGSAFFVIYSKERRPWLYPEKYYRALFMSELTPKVDPTEETLRTQRRTHSLADLAAWDEQGRCVMPEKLLTRSGIQKDVTLVGVWDHLELWNRAEWDAYSEQL